MLYYQHDDTDIPKADTKTAPIVELPSQKHRVVMAPLMTEVLIDTISYQRLAKIVPKQKPLFP